MNYIKDYFFCSPKLLRNVDEIKEIENCLHQVKWEKDFKFHLNGKIYKYQTGYNKALEIEFKKYDWQLRPILCHNPRLIGDFQKNDVFIEVQFGNSATIYRDYYKFHYGLTHKLLSLAVLIVPTHLHLFFPTRPNSVHNMAEFDFAKRYFNLLPIPVPILLIGLLPES